MFIKKYSKRWYNSFYKKLSREYNKLGKFRIIKPSRDDEFGLQKYHNSLGWCEVFGVSYKYDVKKLTKLSYGFRFNIAKNRIKKNRKLNIIKTIP